MKFKKILTAILSKSQIVLIFVLLTVISTSQAQEKSIESDGPAKKNNFSDRFFMAISTSTYMDLIVSPLKYHYGATGNTDTLGNPTFSSIPYQTQQFNIVSIGMEPRYNLKEFDENSSLSISAPISFGIGNSMSAAGKDLIVRGINGFGSVQIPLLLKLNIGNGSTYKTEKNLGFSVGAGLEMNKLGIINLTDNAKEYNKAFILPSFSTGFTFMRGGSPMEVNFKYAFGKLSTQKLDTQDNVIKDNNGIPYERVTRGHSIKLSFVYLMNY